MCRHRSSVEKSNDSASTTRTLVDHWQKVGTGNLSRERGERPFNFKSI